LTDDEERYTFSSLMTLLVESESRLKQLYETTAETTSQPNLKSLLSDFAKSSSRTMQMMRRVRVESVVEIALEPISGLKLAELVAIINITVETRQVSNIEKLMALERTVSDLYARASPKIARISAEAGQLLRTLPRESIDRVHELKRFIWVERSF